jgi:hypothetical protein
VIFERPQALRSSGFAPKVCIVGSGPAGITLALGLARRGVPSLIVEAGSDVYSPASQDLYCGTASGDGPIDLRDSRLRQFGGTSGHWEGWCRPLDAVDFEPRPGMPDSGWPIRRADLEPWATAAEAILDISPLRADRALTPGLDEIDFAMSPPVRFAAKYWALIAASPAIGLLLDSPVVDIVPVRGRIDSVALRRDNGSEQAVRAPYFCLCTGGIENSRLLLAANARHGGGVVPGARTLGRYWMDHLHFGVGDAVLSGSGGESARGMRFFAPSAGVLRDNAVGNAGLRLFSGTSRIKRLLKSGACAAPQLFDDLLRRYDAGLACGMQLVAAWEQAPQWDNRVGLDPSLDALGLPRVHLHWQRQPIDRATILHALGLFGSYLIDAELGRLRPQAWLAQGGAYPERGEPLGIQHAHGGRAGPGRGGRRLQGVRRRQPLHRRLVGVPDQRARQPDLHHRATRAAPGRAPGGARGALNDPQTHVGAVVPPRLVHTRRRRCSAASATAFTSALPTRPTMICGSRKPTTTWPPVASRTITLQGSSSPMSGTACSA